MQQIFGLLRNKAFWQAVIVLAVIIVAYNYSKIPEHCFKNTEENKATLSGFGIAISREDTSNNEICIQTRDAELVTKINEKIQDVELQKYKEQLASRERFWDKYFYPLLIAAVVVIVVLGLAHMEKNRY